MSFELRDGQGTLFLNDKKDNDTQPDRRGELVIDGKVYKLAGWLKQSKQGQPWLSLKVELKKPPVESVVPEDTIPF